MYLLDTNVISELRKARPHGGVLAWISTIPESQLYVSAVTILELQMGSLSVRKQDSQKADELDRWIQELESTFEIAVLDGEAARHAARLVHGKSPELFADSLIAGIALARHMTVATRNTKDFEKFGLQQVNPFLYR